MKICVEENLDADMIVQHRNTHLTESLPMTNKLICCLCGFKFSKEKFFANHVELCQNRELPGDGLQLPITKKLICSLCGFKFSEEKFSDNHVKLCQNYELAGDRLQENTTCQNEDVKKEVQSSDVLDNNLAMISIGDIKSEEFISIDGVQVEEKLDENTNDGTCQNKDVKKEVEINGLIDENLSVKPIGDIKPEELISIGPVQVVRKFDENTAVQYNNTHLIKNFSKEKSLTNHYKFCQNIEHSGDCLIQNGTSQNKDVKKEVENNGLLEENLAVKPIGDTNSENKMLFKCNICAFATTQSQYLNSHKRTKHAVRILSHNLCLTTYVNNQCQQPLYTCKHCDFSTRTSKEFITHTTTHPPLEKIKCSQCNYFSTKQKLENHIKCYHTENQLKCLICNKPYPNRYSLVAHVKTHSNEESFKCLICHNTFRFRSSLDAHLVSHSKEVILHDHDYDTVRVHTFKCKRCDYSTTSHKEYQTHSKTHMFQCSLCSYAGRHLKIHMRTHTKEKPYKCSQCDYACAQKGNLALHMRRHTGLKPFKCAICDYVMRDKTNLKKHEKIHTGERPYKCKICDYASIQSSALKLHMSIHTGDMPYKCTICGYATAHGPGLKMHLRIHTGERPYKCTICGYAATLNSGLKLHMSVHTGQKPFKCTICDYASTKRSNLKVHMRIHAKQSRNK